MMRITNLADYALILCCQLAHSNEGLHSAITLSETTGIHLPTTSKILGNLARSNILTSQRGLKGGFKLEREAGEITVTQIIEAIDGPITLTSCVEEDFDCDYYKLCTMRPHWQAINEAVRTALGNITLLQISQSPNPKGFLEAFSVQPTGKLQ
jgi:FeS assembly SUF system regulator